MNILNYTLKELETIFVENNLKKFLGIQIFDWIYKKRELDFLKMTNISKINRDFLASHFELKYLKISIVQIDPVDGTRKYLFELEDGNKIETVLMKFDYGYSVCVTTQVGCNMGCKFCASGLLKKKRNLETWEIVAQVLTIQKFLDEEGMGRVSNIVIMGIGEPLDNYDNVSKFISIVNSDNGLQIGARKITLSTCGLVHKFQNFIDDHPQVGLAISLHAPNNSIRDSIMPINKAYNFEKLLAAAKDYTQKTNRRITFEYIMLKGVNDSIDNAIELSRNLKDILCYVNLIPYNSVNEHSYQRSENIKKFADVLLKNGITVTIRQEKGSNISAACGQLRAQNEKN
ncbi:MAG: 23S rRNA (adenine(2503)-C(2))-methyltransferase RlmN [Candidatus Ureaplasma intestinipullorum]|uniref:Probable dual-specificity RNA methyltransferase RlmN n=1 Tax=Candidatus Ureaplasma intestinipullorum TaxID=2838770 RepID=A0A9E2KWP5_9BACT|nr:23S rRNA (adenine(2503)-C(2))-methyltransferase RlmN [Candidatus Ureaplasma intestinipullorum]